VRDRSLDGEIMSYSCPRCGIDLVDNPACCEGSGRARRDGVGAVEVRRSDPPKECTCGDDVGFHKGYHRPGCALVATGSR
jgi:hypothetical protein